MKKPYICLAPQRSFQLPDAMVFLGFGRRSASPPKRCLRSLFRFILPAIEQIQRDSMTPARFRNVPARHSFLPICHFSSADRSTRAFLPMLPPGLEALILPNLGVQF